MTKKKEKPILEVNGLKKYFPIEKGFLKRVEGHVRAVDDVSFKVYQGDTLGIVGESGCGKTTTARLVMRALESTDGEILFTTDKGKTVDMTKLDKRELKEVRRDMQMIFQDPYSSLNPRMPILDIIAEPMLANGWKRKDCEERVGELLELVGLQPKFMRRYPHAFSGGQRQRIGIARALALNPRLVVADEPVSALDVSVQAQILNLLMELQEKMGLTFLFIAHDLSVIRYICNKVAVMYLGRIVEIADTEDLYTRPLHPYTSGLISAVPDADPKREWLYEAISGEIEDSLGHQGCAFAPRCKYAEEKCLEEVPVLRMMSDAEHGVACHRAEELSLKGV